jgi:hypothetical protein
LFGLLVRTNRLQRPYKAIHIAVSLTKHRTIDKVPEGFAIFDIFLIKLILS